MPSKVEFFHDSEDVSASSLGTIPSMEFLEKSWTGQIKHTWQIQYYSCHDE